MKYVDGKYWDRPLDPTVTTPSIKFKLLSFISSAMRVNNKSSRAKISTMEKTTPPANEVSRFYEGSLVEVTSDEDGYKGAWFEAQIVTQLSSPASRGRKRKKGGSFVVQYLKLVEESTSRLLKETVEGKQLRPLPPDVDEPIGVHDVVDAFLNDGWWEGVVIEVLEESKIFSLIFEIPSPHVMEFDRDTLRHHLNWDGGNWFRSSKNTNQLATPPSRVIAVEEFLSSESFMSPENTGEDISTLIRELEDSMGHGSEIAPVKAISTSTDELFSNSEGGITLSQGCKKRKTKGACTPPSSTKLPSDMIFSASLLRDIFENASDSQQSRPTTSLKIVDLSYRDEDISAGKDDVTPQHPNNTGSHLGKDRTANFSSWEAYSLKGDQNAFRAKALEAFRKPGEMGESNREMRSRPSSSFDSNPPADIRELYLPDITSHLESLHSRDETAGASPGIMMQAQASKCDGTCPATVCISDDQRKKPLAAFANSISTLDVFFPTGSSISATNTGVDSSFPKEHEDSHSENQMEPYMGNLTCTDLTVISKTDVRLSRINKLISGNIYTSLFHIKPSSIMMHSETFRALFGHIIQNQFEVQHRPLLIVHNSSSNDVSSEKPDKPTDIVVYGGKEKTRFLSLENSSLKALPSAQNSSGVEVLDSFQKGYSTKDGTLEIMTVTSCSSSSNPLPFQDIVQLDLLDTIVDPWILQHRDETVGSLGDTNDRTLPFCKKSPLWKHIELLEAFHAFPQNPHFRPLKQYNDSYREAMAIACMVIFEGLVEEMLELVADVPKSNIDKIMKDILPLEYHGFNVAPIKDRLTMLQRVKEEREQLLQASVEAKSKIKEQAHAMAETSAKLENAVKQLREFEEKVSKLKEEVAELRSIEEEQVSEMIARRSKDDSIDQGILQNGIHFQNILRASTGMPSSKC